MYAQQVEIAPIPLTPQVSEQAYKQAVEERNDAQTRLKKALSELEQAHQNNADLKRRLGEAQKELGMADKNCQRKLGEAQQKADQTIQTLKNEIERLRKPPPTTTTPPSTTTTTAPRRDRVPYPRRSDPKTVSIDDVERVFNLDNRWRPKQYVPVTDGRFETIKNGQVVKDNATGLMWQQGGSDWTTYEHARQYIQKLNRERFAGYRDWRLPTVDELTSLLTPTKQNGDLYISSVFGPKQYYVWSSDRAPAGAWVVNFNYGKVNWLYLDNYNYVRAVRSGQ